MDELVHHPSIRVKRKNVRVVQEHSDNIHSLFSVRVSDKTKRDETDSSFVFMPLESEELGIEKLSGIVESLQVINEFLFFTSIMHFLHVERDKKKLREAFEYPPRLGLAAN